MRILFFVFVSVMFISWGYAQDKREHKDTHSGHEMHKSDKSDMHKDHSMKMDSTADKSAEESVIYYTCPMESHKFVNSMEPGKCPECGMNLVPVVKTLKGKAEFYGCPMASHSHIREEKPGKCSECGMELQPMRLDKSR